MSFYTSLSGLKAAQTDLSVTSNNIANVGTTGFKKSRTEFGDIVAASSLQSADSPGLGTRLRSMDQQFTQGSFKTSDRALDLAVSGQGFFVTHSAEGGGTTALTRAGAFRTDTNNNVVTADGAFLQVLPVNDAGEVTGTDLASTVNLRVPPTNTTAGQTAKLDNLSIDEKGLVVAAYADGSTLKLGRIAIATVANPDGLRQIGNASWAATGRSGVAAVGGAGSDGLGAIQSGALEEANVDLTEELVSLIQAQRNFQANAKAIDTANQLTDTAVNLRN
ncbi:MAG: flagellar basal body FlaE protein [Sphingomonas bacterium]|jgi:flagellar hook protein FlgE|nr:flagellar hook-basal body complex protein [Sphingomonas bacterium]MDB5690115.1 flagellar basal body FlaE protein [Sphingomonas bacterium]